MKILLTGYFKKMAHKMKNKFPNLREDLYDALKNFNKNSSIYIGRSIYKMRIKSQDLNKGKSGGLRCYVYLMNRKDALIPLCIYFKSERESITPAELETHFINGINELKNYLC